MSADHGTAALAAREVVRWFGAPTGARRVLDAVDLDVRAGELVTIGGPSGSGKSALLAILCGFDRPDSGTVLLLGEPLTKPPRWERCAILPQSIGLLDELTLAENVALPIRLTGQRTVLAGRVAPLLAELAVDHLADRFPHEVSFGQRQRAALARALVAGPRVLVADEPTAHLDADAVTTVLRLVRGCADGGAAVLVATHDPRVHAVADRTLRLDGGRLAAA
ncbi:ABC transporter ATP-binding protein [Gandjariella thermophila]|uniref:ABC transporter ATP-binding protein n=1 Tax=Gandjariella thermophila TaxID=1931992 RepID=A0A4D4J4U2_9PSEU|nr:ABC transporter ATP-binding protein [Gandjariella thermophila]GDY28997.1 ABC transporter ATP-binding protein [Gandjariella thermophila]